MKSRKTYIENLIAQGETQTLDFKFEISDSKKIARTLSAFSNTDGGTLLIGVKDNGAIAGINSSEEYHMLEAAAEMYCNPKVDFKAKEWNIEGKTILEIIIPQRSDEPTMAPNHEGKYRVYIRVGDQNILANGILLKVWKIKESGAEIKIEYKEAEKALLNYLEKNDQITISKFQKLAMIPRKKAENILVGFIVLNIIRMVFTEKQVYYTLSDPNINED